MKVTAFLIEPSRVLATCSLLLLAACGGEGTATDDAASEIAAISAVSVVAPLLADDGSVMLSDPKALPRDPGARSRSGRYATAAQARNLMEALDGDAIEVDVECCGDDGIERTLAIVRGVQAARNMPAHTPVLVRGGDLRLAAMVADRLELGGLTHVWMVTP